MRPLAISLSFGVVFLLICFVGHAQENSFTRPNVIVLLTDDQGYGDFSCHGNPLLKTPALDKLHSESVRLTDFHVAPMCTPTRGQLLTGIDAMRNGATAVCQGRSMIRNGIPTMADYFAAAGYSTGHFGKWHLGDSYPHRPQDRGFQETLHHPAWGITSLADHFGNSYFDPYLRYAKADELNTHEKQFEGYCTDIFFQEAMKWMKGQHENNQPFFLYLPTNTPHVPNWVAGNYSEPYRSIGTYNGVEVPANFYGMIANIDENIEVLDKFLVDEGLKDNTILIYLNDNGTQSKAASEIFNAGMRGYKTQMYEGGHRVSCFIRWPDGGLSHGQDIPALTQVQDILPTLMELCEIDYENKLGTGVSLAGLLKNPQYKLPDRKLVIQYSFGETSGSKWNRAIVLWNKWRLVGPDELYDLKEDPHQDNNVYKVYPQMAEAMKAHYEKWYLETRPMFDQVRNIHLGNQAANPMMLYSNDWVGGYCDNPPNLVAANKTGYWDVVIEEEGEYVLELRRWPEESGLSLTAGVAGESIKAHETFTGDNVGARPIHSARLSIGDFDEAITTTSEDRFASFKTKLPAGKHKLETQFLDKDGEVLCSAIYVKVNKLRTGK